MKVKLAIYILSIVLFIFVGSSVEAQRKKQTRQTLPQGEVVPKVINQKAMDAASQFWESRILKCGTDTWYTLRVNNDAVDVYELKELPKVIYKAMLPTRSRIDMLNGLEAAGIFDIKEICRVFDFGFESDGQDRKSKGRYENAFLQAHKVIIKQGEIEISLLTDVERATGVKYLGHDSYMLDVWHKPYSCEDVQQYIENGASYPGKVYLCLKQKRYSCNNQVSNSENYKVPILDTRTPISLMTPILLKDK